MNLLQTSKVVIYQRREFAELFGFETRNKYEIFDENKNLIGFCAEQQKGFFGFLFRQFLGHWRSFEVHFFNTQRQEIFRSEHPFRFFFQEFQVFGQQNNLIGSIHQRFGIFTKKFDVRDSNGQLLFEMRSGFFSFWTFPFFGLNGAERALVQKKWTGLLKELFLDADNFMIDYSDPSLNQNERLLILAAGVFTDLQYFERKANSAI